jgi:hypothetical protein
MCRAGEPVSRAISAGRLLVEVAPMAAGRAMPLSLDLGAPMIGAAASGLADAVADLAGLVAADGARWTDGTYVAATGAEASPAVAAEDPPLVAAEDAASVGADDGPAVAADRRARVSGAACVDSTPVDDGPPAPAGADDGPRMLATPSADPSPRGADELLAGAEAADTGSAGVAEIAPWDGSALIDGVCAAPVDSSWAVSSGARCTPGKGLAASGAPRPALRDWASVSLAGRPDAGVGEGALAAR